MEPGGFSPRGTHSHPAAGRRADGGPDRMASGGASPAGDRGGSRGDGCPRTGITARHALERLRAGESAIRRRPPQHGGPGHPHPPCRPSGEARNRSRSSSAVPIEGCPPNSFSTRVSATSSSSGWPATSWPLRRLARRVRGPRFGTQLVVVLGHTRCGAILATLEELRRRPIRRPIFPPSSTASAPPSKPCSPPTCATIPTRWCALRFSAPCQSVSQPAAARFGHSRTTDRRRRIAGCRRRVFAGNGTRRVP